MRNFIESIINQHNYVLADMEERINKMYVMGKISEEDLTYLLNLAAENADDNRQIDVAALIADLVRNIVNLPNA